MRSLVIAAGICVLTSGAFAQNERQVQIRSIDFENGVLELFNFASSDIQLDGWRFCSHDFDQVRRYTSRTGLDGVVIEAGTSVYVHFENDAPGGDADRVNRTSLGGAFALPLDQDAYGIQIYAPIGGHVSFGNSTQIADHLQWNIDGEGTGSSEARTQQAVSQNLWSATGDFIETMADSTSITLIDVSGDEQGGPIEYEVAGQAGEDCPTDVDQSGMVDIEDLLLVLREFGVSDAGDTNNDGMTDIEDLLAVLREFGSVCD